ncbi:hypothetical protein [Leptonema illini]|uniref:Lipoprotein n=1 Tax=Leptonema illini DSM 21528 TaxID=929563 RepID=H2CHJ9_9LEPT|nr:hypothetical protein [Leptonema illini]EHQ04822.1 hypothetical protein Lepil_0111 [Leptonema illini DSM 21528]
MKRLYRESISLIHLFKAAAILFLAVGCDTGARRGGVIYEHLSSADTNGTAFVFSGRGYVRGIRPVEGAEIAVAYVPEILSDDLKWKNDVALLEAAISKIDFNKLRFGPVERTNTRGCFKGPFIIPDAYDGLIILRIKRPEDARPVYHVVYHESLTPTVVVILPSRKDARVDLTAEQVNRMVLFEPCEW